jgi:O-acetyl-ADP-ribose deacetylase (regulator of RNase III)
MPTFQLTPTCRLTLQRGDLTRWEGDAIVNAANEKMLGGGGVDGAIHRAAGPDLKAACRAVPEVSPGVRCPTGEARITPAFGDLKVRHVIHTVGPAYRSPGVSGALLRDAYRSSLRLARENGLRTIAFPAISCGVYRYPLPVASEIALTTCFEEAGGLEGIDFVLFGVDTWNAWRNAATRLGLQSS